MALNKFFKSLSIDDKVKEQIKSEIIMDNVVGITSISGGAGASTIAANISHILSKYNLIQRKKETLTEMVVCIVDFNVFNPLQYQYLSCEEQEKGQGLLDAFISGPEAISRNLKRVSNTLSLLTPSPKDELYEYFDITAEQVNETLEYLKDHFDIVIVDIPNTLPSPLCYEAIKKCNKVFVVWDENINIYQATRRMIDFLEKIKIRKKITHVIFNKKTKTPLVVEKIEELVKKLGIKLLTVIPYSQDIVNNNLNGTLYFDQAIIRKDVKRSFMKICSEITDIKLSNIVSGGNHEHLDD